MKLKNSAPHRFSRASPFSGDAQDDKKSPYTIFWYTAIIAHFRFSFCRMR
jgi:hypothetical protein